MARKTPAPPRRTRGRPPATGAAHRRVAAELRARIRTGAWPPGTVLPSWRALANELQVTPRVVQLACEALKADGLLAANAQRRLVARDWRSPGTALERQLLVLMTVNPALLLRGRMYADLVEGILRGAGEMNCPLQVAYDDRLSNHVPRELFERPCCGAVLVGKVSEKTLKAYAKLNVPVAVADHPGGLDLHSAGVDNEGATALLLEQVLARGHRRFAFLRRMWIHHVHQVDPDARARQAALEKGLAAAGLPKRALMVCSVFPNEGVEAPAFGQVLNARTPISAVVASDDAMARLFIRAAREAGRRVPHDCSVAAYQVASAATQVSGVGFDFVEVGRQAARLAGGARTPPQHTRAPGRWLAGETLGEAHA